MSAAVRRFWDAATLAELPGGYAVMLDGRPMRIPGGSPLLIQGRALAEAIAAEWQAAGGGNGGSMTYDAVPLTRLAGTAQDRIAPDPAPVALELARYAETDLLCYRAEGPAPLVARQAHAWQPWLDWLALRHGARLEPTQGVMFRAQDPVELARVAEVMAAQTPLALAGLGIAIPVLGSAALGLALADGALSAAEAHGISALDELYETEQWGEDDEAVRRRAQAAADVALADRLMRLAAAA